MSDNKHYWVNQNGVQAGPVTKEELAKMAIDASAYVWCAGMDDWAPITQIDELNGTFAPAPEEANGVVDGVALGSPLPAEQNLENEPEPQPVDDEKTDQDDEQPEKAPVDIPVIPPVVVPQPLAPGVVQGIPLAAQAPAPQNTEPATPKCPPTNLVWAIIATVLCCLPLGAVAIYYSVKVSTAYNAGDYAKAERMSEVSAWWCIGTIVAGIIATPFTMLLM